MSRDLELHFSQTYTSPCPGMERSSPAFHNMYKAGPGKDTGDLNMRDLLYDLVVKNVKKIHSHNLVTLSSVYRQLDSDLTLPK